MTVLQQLRSALRAAERERSGAHNINVLFWENVVRDVRRALANFDDFAPSASRAQRSPHQRDRSRTKRLRYMVYPSIAAIHAGRSGREATSISEAKAIGEELAKTGAARQAFIFDAKLDWIVGVLTGGRWTTSRPDR